MQQQDRDILLDEYDIPCSFAADAGAPPEPTSFIKEMEIIRSGIYASLQQHARHQMATGGKKAYDTFRLKNCRATLFGMNAKPGRTDKVKPTEEEITCLSTLDIDLQDDQSANRDILPTIPWVVACATSIGGNGLFAVIKVDPLRYAESVQDAILILKGLGVEVAQGQQNPNRIRYTPSDENAYFNLQPRLAPCVPMVEKAPIETVNVFELDSTEDGRLTVQQRIAPKKTKVSARTTIDDLAKRHLKEKTHHPEFRAFATACFNIGLTPDIVQAYVAQNAQADPESAHHDKKTFLTNLKDWHERWNENSPGVLLLTKTEFAFKLFLFKFTKEFGWQLHGLYHEGIRQYLSSRGFKKRFDSKGNSVLIQQTGQIISLTSPEKMRDNMLRSVESLSKNIEFTFQGEHFYIPPEAAIEKVLKQAHNVFNEDWMKQLPVHEERILKDTQKEIYIISKSYIITITKDSIDQIAINDLEGFCIWNTQQLKRDFFYAHEPHAKNNFKLFLKNVALRNKDDGTIDEAASEENFICLCSHIGYLLHHYMRPSEGQAVLFYDSTITDLSNPMGGSGKGLIANGIKMIRCVTKVDGKHFDNNNRFKFEALTTSTQMLWIDDTKPTFDFSVLHSCLTDGFTVERKYRDQEFIDPKDSPKVLICSNSILKGGGSTNKRRQSPFELSDYYSSKIKTGLEKPIEQEHGGLFFTDDWADQEWNAFLSFMCECGQLYLAKGLIPQIGGNVSYNRFRQSTSDEFALWCAEQTTFDQIKKTENNTKEMYDNFKTLIGDDDKFTQRKFTNWLKHFAESRNWKFCTRRTDGKTLFWFISA